MSKPASGEQTPPFLIVLGLDNAQKPHASQFGEADAPLAEKAAGLMGMAVLPVEGDELTSLAAKLPPGRVFASGNAFVPFVARPLYDRLVAVGEATGRLKRPEATTPAHNTERASAGAGGASTTHVATADPEHTYTLPESWGAIEVGSLVLVSEGEVQGWWEALVIAITPLPDTPGETLLTLQFRDFPDYQQQIRRASAVALLHPHSAMQVPGAK